MQKKYPCKNLLFISVSVSLLLLTIASCKKNGSAVVTPSVATPTKLALIETDSSIYKLLLINIANIGTQTVNDELIFDTGSGGMVMDAEGILPASMITSSGFNFTGDSTVVNGITITNQSSMVAYGDNTSTTDKVYGNLAYASVTIGDQNGTVVIKRLPFFLYYKAVNGQGAVYGPHQYDTFGVSDEYDITFANNAYITSPFSSFNPGTGLTKGFKMAVLSASNFSYIGNSIAGAITLGLTSSDLSSTSGFTMNQLTYYSGDGYAPVIPTAITYNNKSFTTDAIFDTGTEPYSYLEDPTAPNISTLLPSKTPVSIATNSGFNYSYTTSDGDNLTYVENPRTSGGTVSVLSLEFFLNNEYMLDYTNHKLGLKNN
jgi:hypothetical protein